MRVPERDRLRLQIATCKIRLAQLDLQAAQEEKLVAEVALRRMGLQPGDEVNPDTGEVLRPVATEPPGGAAPAEVDDGS